MKKILFFSLICLTITVASGFSEKQSPSEVLKNQKETLAYLVQVPLDTTLKEIKQNLDNPTSRKFKQEVGLSIKNYQHSPLRAKQIMYGNSAGFLEIYFENGRSTKVRFCFPDMPKNQYDNQLQITHKLLIELLGKADLAAKTSAYWVWKKDQKIISFYNWPDHEDPINLTLTTEPFSDRHWSFLVDYVGDF